MGDWLASLDLILAVVMVPLKASLLVLAADLGEMGAPCVFCASREAHLQLHRGRLALQIHPHDRRGILALPSRRTSQSV